MGHIISPFRLLSTLISLVSSIAFDASAKLNVHACWVSDLCDPQNRPPHLHVNPVNPTFLLHTKHLFFFVDCVSVTSVSVTVLVSVLVSVFELSIV